jgi:type II secretory pathway pseudopilin PulG
MMVVAILGVLAAIAIGAYTRQVRNARKSEVIGDLSSLTLRQKTFLSVNGHYASSTNNEGPASTYPTAATVTGARAEVQWVVTDPAYTGSGLGDGVYTRGGPAVHGFDALRFMPEGGNSYCGYATISGWGTNAVDPDNPGSTLPEEPPSSTLALEVFRPGTEHHYANDWFYSYALCDFDYDGVYWAFTSAHYGSDVSSNSTADGTYHENE